MRPHPVCCRAVSLFVAASLSAASTAQQDYGEPCDISSCECAGYSFAASKGKIFQTPPNEHGWSYKYSMCEAIPRADLPLGCQGYSAGSTAVQVRRHELFVRAR